MRKQAGISTNILAKMGKDELISMGSLAKIYTTLNSPVNTKKGPASGGSFLRVLHDGHNH